VASNLGEVQCGVPQGSVLGPLLFLIYMNDIYRAVDKDKLRLFADDTNLFITGKSFVELETTATKCLANMESWFLANKLSLNVDKTCYTLFSKSKRAISNVSLKLTINGQLIERVKCCKYLGVFIDESLNWSEHIDFVYKKLIKFTSIFYKLRDLIPKQCLSTLYFSFVYPHLCYGVEVYANCTKSAINKLNVLNNKILRILFKVPFKTNVNDLYSSLNVLPIKLLHELHLLTFVHKCIYGNTFLPEIFHDYFSVNTNVHYHNTRQKNNLHFISVQSTIGLKCTAYKAIKLWNPLPDDIKNITTLSIFKSKVKTYLLNNIKCNLY
jgi:hypothetical protein